MQGFSNKKKTRTTMHNQLKTVQRLYVKLKRLKANPLLSVK